MGKLSSVGVRAVRATSHYSCVLCGDNALDRELAAEHCNGSCYTQRDAGISIGISAIIEWCVCECVYVCVCVWGLLNCRVEGHYEANAIVSYLK